MKFTELLKAIRDRISFYYKATRNLDFMIRYILYQWTIFVFWRIWIKNNEQRKRISNLLSKPFIFTTPHGTFLWRTPNWIICTQPDCPGELVDLIKKNTHENKHKKNNILINIGAHIGRIVVEMGEKYIITNAMHLNLRQEHLKISK